MRGSNAGLLFAGVVCAACAQHESKAINHPSNVEPELNVTSNDIKLHGNKAQSVAHAEPTSRKSSPSPKSGLHNIQQPPAARTRHQPSPATNVRPENDDQARAAFTSALGYDLRGEAEFTELSRGVEVRVAVNGAPPGVKGVHIHQKADCSDIPNKSMGGHFSPDKQDSGFPTNAEHHLGDLGNIQIGADGAGELKVVIPAANLKDADTHSFLTRSIVVHETSDTGTGEAGESGEPIACGIIDR